MYEDVFARIRNEAEKRNLKDSTIDAYCNSVEYFLRTVNKDISALTTDDVDAFLTEKRLTGMFRYAKFRKYTDFSISAFFADYKLSRNIFCNPVVKDEEQVFTDDEMAAIFAWINDDPERRRNIHNLTIMFCFYTGL